MIAINQHYEEQAQFQQWVQQRSPISSTTIPDCREISINDFDALAAKLKRCYPLSKRLVSEVCSWIDDGLEPDIGLQHLQVIEALD